MSTQIPIENIYYLLCYGWESLHEGELVDVKASDTQDVVNLFARILLTGTQHLMRRGLDRGYVAHQDEIPGIKGKFLFTESIKRNSLSRGQAVCAFDEFNYDVLHNQILKATIYTLIKTEGVDRPLKNELKSLYRTLPEISDIRLTVSMFSRVTLHRNNRYYLFILKVCEFLYQNIMPSEEKGMNRLRDFLRDEAQMRRLFEKFVFRFYEKNLTEYRVKAEQFRWNGFGLDEESDNRLPVLQTDICLTNKTEKIVIDTKFSTKALSGGLYSEKINTGYLYQLFAYLMNLPEEDREKEVTGILLYPTIKERLDFTYEIHGHRVLIQSIDLSKDWQEIEEELLWVVGKEEGRLVA